MKNVVIDHPYHEANSCDETATSVVENPIPVWHEQLVVTSTVGRRHRLAYRLFGRLYACWFKLGLG